jgi:chemotaxis protein methyltransferase CheR
MCRREPRCHPTVTAVANAPTDTPGGGDHLAVDVDDAALAYFTHRCQSSLRLDLASYKPEQIRRRLAGLMHAVGVANVVELARVLAEDEAKVARFRQSFTIHVTEFFRDPQAFKQVETAVLPSLRRLGRPAQLWSAACSIGAEPLTLAILLNEASIAHAPIVATDVCAATIARARAGGPFDVREVKNLTERQRDRHLRVDDGAYMVSSPLHRAIDFRVHDLIDDPYPGSFDLVVCRNVLIYFGEASKRRVLDRLAAAVRPGGHLFLGGTEIVQQPAELSLRLVKPSLYEKIAS